MEADLFFFCLNGYVGRMGETRETDGQFMRSAFKYKGETIEEIPREKPADGVYDLTFVNENVSVDGWLFRCDWLEAASLLSARGTG